MLCENIVHIKTSLVHWVVAGISRKSARAGIASVNEVPVSRVLSWLHFFCSAYVYFFHFVHHPTVLSYIVCGGIIIK